MFYLTTRKICRKLYSNINVNVNTNLKITKNVQVVKKISNFRKFFYKFSNTIPTKAFIYAKMAYWQYYYGNINIRLVSRCPKTIIKVITIGT